MENQSLVEFVRNSGFLGICALVLKRSAPAAFAWYVAIAMTPLALGMVGTWIGNANIEGAVRAGADSDPARLELSHGIAASSTQIGATATAILVALGLLGMAVAARTRGDTRASARTN
ncbi:MAG: hypothetical protein IT454_00780 [Planctomycetes bacterium]|nr:hypothetical protein [Planctomycetota bacterium]